MSDSYYDLLGVSPTASTAEIRSRYHEMAKRYHPDHHRDAPEHLQRNLDEMMASLNDAWATLGDPARRADYDRMLRGQGSGQGSGRRTPTNRGPASARPSAAGRPRRADECMLCGSAPAVEVTLRQATGRVIMWTARSLTATLCRDCGTAQFRAVQNRTLITGWWGIIAFFANAMYVLGNAGAAIKLRGLAAPTRTEMIDVPLPGPLAVGKPLRSRAGVWVAAALLAGILVIAATSPSTSTTAPTGSGTGLSVGTCVSGIKTVEPVSCSATHSGKIVAEESSSGDCPASADSYVDDGSGTFFCIDSGK